MRRLAMFVSLFVVMSGIVALGRGTPVSAQDADGHAPRRRTVAVHHRVRRRITFPSLAMFHADGTYIEDFPDAGSYSMGVWEPTGERTATVTVYQVYTIDDKLVEGIGTVDRRGGRDGQRVRYDRHLRGDLRGRIHRHRRGRSGTRRSVRRAAAGFTLRIGARGHAGDPSRPGRCHGDAVARETLQQARAGT